MHSKSDRRWFYPQLTIAGNRTELKRLEISKRLVDFLNNDRNEGLFPQTLTILLSYLDDTDAIYCFAEANGISTLTRLTSHHESQVKKRSCMALARLLRNDRVQVLAREAGLLSILSTQLPSTESIIASSCAVVISALARNDANLQEFLRMGTLESLIKHLQGDDKEIKRECMAALASFAGNPRVRSKFQTNMEYLALLVKIMQSDDPGTVLNASHCIIALCEDGKLCF